MSGIRKDESLYIAAGKVQKFFEKCDADNAAGGYAIIYKEHGEWQYDETFTEDNYVRACDQLRMRNIIDNIDAHAVMVDDEGLRIYRNAQWEKVFSIGEIAEGIENYYNNGYMMLSECTRGGQVYLAVNVYKLKRGRVDIMLNMRTQAETLWDYHKNELFEILLGDIVSLDNPVSGTAGEVKAKGVENVVENGHDGVYIYNVRNWEKVILELSQRFPIYKSHVTISDLT